MKLVTSTVISNKRILEELERRRDIERPRPRDILGSWIIWLRCPQIAREARPGQFVMVNCGEECTLPRPLSIHQVNDKGDIALFFAVWGDGKGTKWLSQRKAGDNIDLLDHPLGNGFSINPDSHNLLLVAGGIGIAPLYFLAKQGQKRGLKIKLLRGASGESKSPEERNPSQHYPEELLPSGIDVKTITSSEDGKRDMVLDLLMPEVADSADQVFACGPTAMYREMAQRKGTLGLKGKAVQVSLEMRMGCGLGVCYACTVRTRNGLKQVCKDGPVFELDDIVWDELIFNC